MPTDDLDIEPTEPVAPPDPVAEPTTAPPPAEPSLTSDQLQQALASGNQQVLEAIQQLGTALAAQQEPGQPPVEPSELAERLLTDPKAVLTEEVTEVLKSQLAQPLARTFEIDRDERIDTRAAEIDLDWGDGFFDQHIRPRLTGAEGNLNAWSINQQADPRIIDAAINAILGNDFRDTEKREVLQKALNDTTKARQEREVASAPHMMGPGRPASARSDKLTPDMQTALAGFKDHVPGLTESDIKSALTRENTLEAYRASQGAK